MSDIHSLIFYIVLFILSTFFYSLYNKSDKKFYLFLSFCIPLFIGGLRYRVGTDYVNYLNYYNSGFDIDIGFSLISFIAHKLGSFKVLFFIYNFLTLVFVFLGLSNVDKQNRSIAYFLFLFLYYTTSFNAVRQMLAVSIVFYALKYIVNPNVFKFIFFVVLASLFHNTAFIILLLYPLAVTKNTKIKVLSCLLLLLSLYYFDQIIMYISSISFMQHFKMYSVYTDSISFNNYSFYLEMFIFLVILIFRRGIFDFNSNYKVYFYLYILGLILMLTGFFNPYVKRISLYFIISSIILLPTIPLVCKNPKNKLVMYMFIFGYSVLKFIISVYILRQSNVIPYNW